MANVKGLKMDWRKCFPERLRQTREVKGLTKTALGQLVGVTNVSIREFEIGRKVPTIDTLVALAETLEVSTDYLLGLTNNLQLIPRRTSAP